MQIGRQPQSQLSKKRLARITLAQNKKKHIENIAAQEVNLRD
jgi:hypothetical protein